MTVTDVPLVIGRDIRKTFRRGTGELTHALTGVSLAAERGALTALVGPDGAGKTTLLRLVAGLLTADSGELKVLGIDVGADPHQVQTRVGYTPQRFGLYEDLTVRENLELYAAMHGVTEHEKRERYPRLLEMTALGPFFGRLAGRLSGGMKQKLGLACTLIRWPELLLLDEPTVGVDPLSRRELWHIILDLVRRQGLTVLLSTSYLDEAERCGHTVVLHRGRVLASGHPACVRAMAEGRTFLAQVPAGWSARTMQARLLGDASILDAVPQAGRVRFVKNGYGAAAEDSLLVSAAVEPVPARFEDGFMVLLQESRVEAWAGPAAAIEHLPALPSEEVLVETRDLVRRFGGFTAVNHVSFEVRRGEIFGLLGPNGAGKTTTFRMLCGLLPATGGRLRVAGVDLLRARASARERIGYVAQKFSLYGHLSVLENLQFFSSAYGLRSARRRERIDWGLREFELVDFAHVPSAQLPGGYRQRLAMAAALLHEPEILFLDEPTSGVDPLARRDFWRRITAFAEQGVTVIVTTHFMEEAEYCDRIVIMDSGRVLASGTPAQVRDRAGARGGQEPTIEDAFIATVQESRSMAVGGGT
ncbi:MAG: ABC transporter ATP-binding protein [Phycisphaerae bacterium]|nr:ABC transporter ATP-binding protein [Phycisphaerae bacterium]